MKHLAVALIVVVCVVCDFGSDLWLTGDKAKGWDWTATLAMAAGGAWFAGHWDDK